MTMPASASISLPGRIPVRSMGLKLLLVCLLALLMTIPALCVFALLADRTSRAHEVTKEVGDLMGGPQTFLGPVLAIPYSAPPQVKDQPPTSGVYLVFPTTAQAQVAAATEERHRSLFKVPVFHADLRMDSEFDLTSTPSNAPPGATLDWSRAEFLVGVSDPRGAQADAVLTAGGKSTALAPAVSVADQSSRDDSSSNGLHFFGASAAGIAQPGARFAASARLKFSGAQRLAVLPYGKTSTLAVNSDWKSPSFDGGFLPTRQSIDGAGFTASWSAPFIARGVAAEGGTELISRLQSSAFGVSFVEPADPYQSVSRALKYALMFVGLVFLAYFVFETMTGKRVHPAQYVLIGLAQMVFYLLLLSLSEQIGFDWAFVTAASATVSLISAYAGWVFESRKQGFIALVAFSLLYGLIYVLMRLEDFALLVGAVTSFLAIASVMYFTRRIAWYGAPEAEKTSP